MTPEERQELQRIKLERGRVPAPQQPKEDEPLWSRTLNLLWWKVTVNVYPNK